MMGTWYMQGQQMPCMYETHAMYEMSMYAVSCATLFLSFALLFICLVAFLALGIFIIA